MIKRKNVIYGVICVCLFCSCMEKEKGTGFIVQPTIPSDVAQVEVEQENQENVAAEEPDQDQDQQQDQVESVPAIITVNNITAGNTGEETELTITLSYTESTNALATDCTISNLSKITETTSCACDIFGVCTVGMTGNPSYYGPASFNYSITVLTNTSAAAIVGYTIDEAPIVCPNGYIGVIANADVGTSEDFCVMKYEAKETAAGVVSQASSTPDTYISYTDAQANCEAISNTTFADGTFSLISNPEWMTIARDIENTNSNWSGGTVGSGMLSLGVNSYSPGAGYTPLTIGNTTDPYTNTGNTVDQAPGSGWESKRTFTLSNSMEIWDFSGNASEWVDWNPDIGFTESPQGVPYRYGELYEFNVGKNPGPLNINDYAPLSDIFSTAQSMGKWIGGNSKKNRKRWWP